MQGAEAVLPRRRQNDLPPVHVGQGRGLDGEPAPVVDADPALTVGGRGLLHQAQMIRRDSRPRGCDGGGVFVSGQHA